MTYRWSVPGGMRRIAGQVCAYHAKAVPARGSNSTVRQSLASGCKVPDRLHPVAGPIYCRGSSRWRSWAYRLAVAAGVRTRKQGANFGHTKIAGKQVLRRGLSPLAITISTETAAPVVAGIRQAGERRVRTAAGSRDAIRPSARPGELEDPGPRRSPRTAPARHRRFASRPVRSSR